MLVFKCILTGFGVRSIQNIAGLPFGIGHHFYEVVPVWGDPQTVRGNDGMDGVVVGRHSVELKLLGLNRLVSSSNIRWMLR